MHARYGEERGVAARCAAAPARSYAGAAYEMRSYYTLRGAVDSARAARERRGVMAALL